MGCRPVIGLGGGPITDPAPGGDQRDYCCCSSATENWALAGICCDHGIHLGAAPLIMDNLYAAPARIADILLKLPQGGAAKWPQSISSQYGNCSARML